MLRIQVTGYRTDWCWKIEIYSDKGLIFSRKAESTKELSEALLDAATIVASEAEKEDEQS